MPHLDSEKKESVFLNPMPEYETAYEFAGIEERWNKLFSLRDDIMKALELARAEKLIGKSLDAKVTVYAKDADIFATFTDFADELKTVFIVSEVELVNDNAPEGVFCETESGIGVKVEQAGGTRCDRCWAYSNDCEADEDGFICARCKKIVNFLA